MRIYICDRCKREFPQPLDEEKYKDGDNWITFDLCAPCRKKLKESSVDSSDKFFVPLIKSNEKK